MLEKIKTAVLIFLILLSMGLTYYLWFGIPPTDERMIAKYEYAYFTEPCSPEEIVTPSKIIFWGGEKEVHVFRRGEEEYLRLWGEGVSLLKRLRERTLNGISDLEKEDLLKKASSKISFVFSTPLPVSFLVPELSLPVQDVEKAVIIPEEHSYLIILEGKDKFVGRIFRQINEQLLDSFHPQKSSPHVCLPDVLTLNINGSNLEEIGMGGDTGKDVAGDLPLQSTSEKAGKKEFSFSLKVQKKGELFLPCGDLRAAEMIVKKEDVDRKQLVRAFFFDLSMARRIDERDGAVFFTDGEKGLRIYPDGLVEYSAPKLEQSAGASMNMSYNTALQKGAENLGIYGGWYPGTYLVEAEKQNESYRLCWDVFYEGFPLQGASAGSEMVINDYGILYYRRSFCQIIEEIGEQKSFRPFEEALCRAVVLCREQLPSNEGVLMEIEPVYYLSPAEKANIKATPAWAVSINGLDKLYLHWQTLEPL